MIQLVVRDGLAALLDASGFDVLGQASRTDEGVELAVALKPDIVLLNVAMPGRGGLDAIGEIRRALPQCAIVAYSSFNGADRFRPGAGGGRRRHGVARDARGCGERDLGRRRAGAGR